MTIQPFDRIRVRLLHGGQPVFLQHGYEAATMGLLADSCGITRRGLYHHFHNKEEVFRAMLRLGNMEGMELADKAARARLNDGGTALDVIAEWLDTRFGRVRRALGLSPHAQELNDIAFKLAGDIMMESFQQSQTALVGLMGMLEAEGRLTLRSRPGKIQAARLIADGVRGINQIRPSVANDALAQHYREIVQAILYGCADA